MTLWDKMPYSFPQETRQNAGNIIHAEAPFRMFPNSVGLRYDFKSDGYLNWHEFVNERCDAVIIPFANAIKLDPKLDHRGYEFASYLDNFRVPVIPFGIGAQSDSAEDEPALGPGMISLVRKLTEISSAISVRGSFTEKVFGKYTSIENVYNTGCPSFYSRPYVFDQLLSRLKSGEVPSQYSFDGTYHHLPYHKDLLYNAIIDDAFIVEPVNVYLHQYYIDALRLGERARLPYFLNQFPFNNGWDRKRLADYVSAKYRIFRDVDAWIAFNSESIDWTFGTRFHVNMASLLSGVPATWIVHDSRTEELCDRLSLPRVPLQRAATLHREDLSMNADYSQMFSNLQSNFAYFNSFLSEAGLESIEYPELEDADVGPSVQVMKDGGVGG